MKIVVMGDTHTGNLLGLTPKKYMRGGWGLELLIEEYWNWFVNEIPKDIDLLICNGDLIDGEGKKNSKDHLTTDIDAQVEMAIEIIETINAKKHIFTFGTPFHTGSSYDAEKQIAKNFDADIRTCQKLKLNGINFNIAHTVGKTGTPVGGDIMIKKKMIWSSIYSIMDGDEQPDIIIRSHAHEYRAVGNTLSKAFVCPALQLGHQDHNQYARRLDGWYDVGFIVFNIEDKCEALNLWPELHIFKYKINDGGYKTI